MADEQKPDERITGNAVSEFISNVSQAISNSGTAGDRIRSKVTMPAEYYDPEVKEAMRGALNDLISLNKAKGEIRRSDLEPAIRRRLEIAFTVNRPTDFLPFFEGCFDLIESREKIAPEIAPEIVPTATPVNLSPAAAGVAAELERMARMGSSVLSASTGIATAPMFFAAESKHDDFTSIQRAELINQLVKDAEEKYGKQGRIYKGILTALIRIDGAFRLNYDSLRSAITDEFLRLKVDSSPLSDLEIEEAQRQVEQTIAAFNARINGTDTSTAASLPSISSTQPDGERELNYDETAELTDFVLGAHYSTPRFKGAIFNALIDESFRTQLPAERIKLAMRDMLTEVRVDGSALTVQEQSALREEFNAHVDRFFAGLDQPGQATDYPLSPPPVVSTHGATLEGSRVSVVLTEVRFDDQAQIDSFLKAMVEQLKRRVDVDVAEGKMIALAVEKSREFIRVSRSFAEAQTSILSSIADEASSRDYHKFDGMVRQFTRDYADEHVNGPRQMTIP